MKLRAFSVATASAILGIGLTAWPAALLMASTEGLQLVGEGTLRWWGLKIYDAKFFAAKKPAPEQAFSIPFALEITYAREFSGQKIAEISAEEIKKLGVGSPQKHDLWLSQMQRVFPDIKPGDKIRGMHDPDRGVAFYYNGQPIGSIRDPEFSRAFFSIWLDPRTAKPELRKSLLGLAGPNGP